MSSEGTTRLGSIVGVTVCTSELAASVDAYTRHLDYRVLGNGSISDHLAAVWNCPGMSGARYSLLAPAAGDDFIFRFIEQPSAAGYSAFTSHGWNAAELIVQDVDEMARQLEDSEFELVGEPANLSFSDDIRAMQIRGPAGEILYLTQIKAPIPGLDTPVARCPVDRAFIIILGGDSLESIQSAYENCFDVPRTTMMHSRVKGMSAALGLPADSEYPICAMPLQGQSFIEADEMPAKAAPRMCEDGLLPPGIAIVSCSVSASCREVMPMTEIDDPVTGRQHSISCYRGPADEFLELIVAEL